MLDWYRSTRTMKICSLHWLLVLTRIITKIMEICYFHWLLLKRWRSCNHYTKMWVLPFKTWNHVKESNPNPNPNPTMAKPYHFLWICGGKQKAILCLPFSFSFHFSLNFLLFPSALLFSCPYTSRCWNLMQKGTH